MTDPVTMEELLAAIEPIAHIAGYSTAACEDGDVVISIKVEIGQLRALSQLRSRLSGCVIVQPEALARKIFRAVTVNMTVELRGRDAVYSIKSLTSLIASEGNPHG